MANTTVYPYGTGGSLPSGIGVVNDLTTGGADKALSAEMGKVLGQEVGGFVEVVENHTELGVTLKKADGTTMSSANGVVKTFRIEQGRKYYASGRQLATATTCAIAYYNGSTFISSEKDGGVLDSADNFQNFPLTVPANADTVKVYGNSNYQSPYLYEDVNAAIGKLREKGFSGKKVAVIGDSISTIYGFDTPYWTVKSVDVGNTIQSYVSPVDVANGTTIGGVALTSGMVDGELHSFTPVAGDVGKVIGAAGHYSGNTDAVYVWSQRLCRKLGAELLANASYSGSGITSMVNDHTGGFTQAWHPCTIGRCRVRDDAGNFINPDVIIVYRGTNDFTYGNNGAYPTLKIDDVDLMAGFDATTDLVDTDTYNFRIGYYLTIQALRAAYPKAMIYVCTLNVFKRVTYDVWPTRNDAFTLPDLNRVIREIAEVTGCGLIELDKDGVTFENCYPTFISDNADHPTHPNDNGHRVMAERAYADMVYSLNP